MFQQVVKSRIESSSKMRDNEFNMTLYENLVNQKDQKQINSNWEIYIFLLNSKSQLKESGSNKKDLRPNQDSIYELTGVCKLVALFHKSMNVNQIKKLLMYDLMRSLYARVRLLVEDLDARKDIIGDAQLEDPNCMFCPFSYYEFISSLKVRKKRVCSK